MQPDAVKHYACIITDKSIMVHTLKLEFEHHVSFSDSLRIVKGTILF